MQVPRSREWCVRGWMTTLWCRTATVTQTANLQRTRGTATPSPVPQSTSPSISLTVCVNSRLFVFYQKSPLLLCHTPSFTTAATTPQRLNKTRSRDCTESHLFLIINLHSLLMFVVPWRTDGRSQRNHTISLYFHCEMTLPCSGTWKKVLGFFLRKF